MIKKIKYKLKSEGWLRFLKLCGLYSIINLLAFPIALIIIALSPWIHIRLIRLFSSRIGHYALNTEFLLCMLEEQKYKNKKYCKLFFYPVSTNTICNLQLHRMWKRVIPILPFAFLCHQIDRFVCYLGGKKYSDDPLRIFSVAEGYQDRWQFLDKTTQCHLSFTAAEKRQAETILRKLSIPAAAPYVCLLMREADYLNIHMPTMNWSYHDYRNVNIENYYEAAHYLAKQGYRVIRMGKHVKTKFDVPHKNIIDYANSPFRSDLMDIYLTAHCTFMMSTSTGLDAIAQMFRRPILVTDFPLCDLKTWLKWDLVIPKKILNVHNNQLITFKEMYLEHNICQTEIVNRFQKKQWVFIDNTEQELLHSVEEMVKRLNNEWRESAEDRLLQQQFWSHYPLVLPEGVSSHQDLKLRLGSAFLRSHYSLLV